VYLSLSPFASEHRVNCYSNIGNHREERYDAYGDAWSSELTSYLIGQYFAGIHIIREMTHFFANIREEKAEELKKLLWKIQDEFIAMNYERRENPEMRWSAGYILAAQEHFTVVADLDGDGNTAEMRAVGWVEFQKKYKPTPPPKDDTDVSAGLKTLFE
jgi:hypothetical protein